MTTASQTLLQRQTAARSALAPKIAGVVMASLFTSVFWVAVTALVGSAFSISFAPAALAMLGCAIAMFLAAVCAPIMLRSVL